MTNKRIQAARGVDVYTKIEARTVKGDGCWQWIGSHGGDGYAQVVTSRVEGKQKTMRVSRLLVVKKLGRDLLPNEVARHTCDVRGCVNPDHLIPGTHGDNMADMVARGRQARGEKHSLSKLCPLSVVAIFYAPRSLRAVARDYGVSWHNVRHIKLGKLWAHLGLVPSSAHT